ncbi:zinc finger protein 830 [Agrilus planipennis]|uniref:Zinc finger protein 830 n=1 Tax=Agrilus planipennis TaxID=224129 RepID=A0A1W4XCG2_AGRPL|nr:zinc finger protein 830 [Agrilus planipennis]
MSATFKNSKRKLSQNELRRFMNEHKEKIQKTTKKIESPLAKYNDAGQLTCILCQSIVKSEAVWTVHINCKQHRLNIEKAKQLKEKTKNFTTPVKRTATPQTPEVPEKKLKGILKNASSIQMPVQELSVEIKSGQLPSDFYENSAESSKSVSNENDRSVKTEADSTKDIEHVDVTLPEGFFDDPKQDAKARNVEYKDPVEEEWERFQREIREADMESAAIIADDQDEATTERQIDEIEEQMRNWSRVLTLEKKKTEVIPQVNNSMLVDANEETSDEDVDVDEIFNWRSKKSF